jgi:hypothetical protein
LSTALALPAVWAQVWLGVGADIERSRWQEFDAQGASLVQEQGDLQGGGLVLVGLGLGAEWRAEWLQVSGHRDYQGVSSAGAPIHTTSQVQRQTASLAGWVPLAGHWSAGARLGVRRLDRDIASVGAVRGYPERFEDWQVSAGAGYALLRGPASTLSATAWLGAGPGGRSTLQLPQADPTTLRLGSSRLLELGLTWQGDLAAATGVPGWQWWVQGLYRQERFGAGPATVVLRNGVIVGAAAQPETRQTTGALRAGLLYAFDGW